MLFVVFHCPWFPSGMWSEPYVDMEFNGSRSDVVYRTFGQGSDVSISCKVQLHHTKFVPLVQWFHDPNEDPDGEKFNTARK